MIIAKLSREKLYKNEVDSACNPEKCMTLVNV